MANPNLVKSAFATEEKENVRIIDNNARAEERILAAQEEWRRRMKQAEPVGEEGLDEDYGDPFDEGLNAEQLDLLTGEQNVIGSPEGGYTDDEAMRRRAAANYVQNGLYDEALHVLQELRNRNGEWYYLSAMVSMGMGNNMEALEQMRTAVNLEPDNSQYRMALNRMEGSGVWYNERQQPFGGMPMQNTDMCSTLCLANLVCSMCCPGSVVCC